MRDDTTAQPRRGRRRVWEWPATGLVVLILAAGQALAGALVTLAVQGASAPDPATGGRGQDALWLGHAWVDGRRGPSDVDALAASLRPTGIRDLFVHTGPFNHDGTLDPGLRPTAGDLVRALHVALPGVRVQAWLGAHPIRGELPLADPATRARVVTSVGQVLDEGFDGIHYDFEPVGDGDERLLAMLRETRPVTAARGALLSVSAVHTEPFPGVGRALSSLPSRLSLWSAGYLGQVASTVDQVALMAYDTMLPSATTYAGYVRRVTAAALAVVPPEVGLLIGVPAYHEKTPHHDPAAETTDAALRGVRLGLAAADPGREFGVAVYVDFTATAADWAAYATWDALRRCRECPSSGRR